MVFSRLLAKAFRGRVGGTTLCAHKGYMVLHILFDIPKQSHIFLSYFLSHILSHLFSFSLIFTLSASTPYSYLVFPKLTLTQIHFYILISYSFLIVFHIHLFLILISRSVVLSDGIMRREYDMRTCLRKE